MSLIGATANFAAIFVTGLQTQQGWPMWPAILATVIACSAIGAINGLLVVRLRVGSFIATLRAASIITAVQSIVSRQAQPLPVISHAWTDLTQRTVLGFQIVFLYLLVLAAFLWWVPSQTPVGRYVFAVGGNAEAARCPVCALACGPGCR